MKCSDIVNHVRIKDASQVHNSRLRILKLFKNYRKYVGIPYIHKISRCPQEIYELITKEIRNEK